MAYSLLGITALIMCIIINKDLLFVRSTKNLRVSLRIYRLFLFSIMVFFIVDAFWGFFDERKLTTLLFLDTTVYFLTMILSVAFWFAYALIYINVGIKIRKFFLVIIVLIIIAIIVVSIVNIFNPILFEIKDEAYIPKVGRYLIFTIQIVIFMIVAIIAFILFIKRKDDFYRFKHFSIGLFSILMALAIVAQVIYPLLPVYSAGCMLSISAVHVFILSNEKKQVQNLLANNLDREEHQRIELDEAKSLVYIDTLTGAKSKHAYVELETKIDILISKNQITEFAIVVFDINGLKVINDTKGHEEGDKYIKESFKLIKSIYKFSYVYRFGGDEFVGFLENEDYNNREELLEKFNKEVISNLNTDKPVVSTGMSIFVPNIDNTFNSVFVRADAAMYERKRRLKSMSDSIKR